MAQGIWIKRGGDHALRTCFFLALMLHGTVFVAGSLGLGTRAEYGIQGQQATASGAPRTKPPEDMTVELETLSEEAEPVRRKAVPTPLPTPMPPGNGGVAQAGSMDLPSYFKNPPPPYPEEARRAKQEGLVLLRVSVDSKGDVFQVRLLKSSGFPSLDEAALGAVPKWRFKPARMGGIAVSTEVDVPISFQLEDRRW
ncbi:MAG TPA: energy transducer TonB [bacterium]|nr:energy transducer TonB [bacterium]